MSSVIATQHVAGVSGMLGQPVSTISIDFMSQAPLLNDKTTAYIFLTYDASNSPSVTSSQGFSLVDSGNVSWPDSGGGFVDQQAVLLFASDRAALSTYVRVGISGYLGSEAIAWRATLVVMSEAGKPTPTDSVVYYGEGSTMTTPATPKGKAYLAFFARPGSADGDYGSTLTYWKPGSNPLVPDPRISAVARSEDPPGTIGAVDGQIIEVVSWGVSGGPGISGGPWLAIKVLCTSPTYVDIGDGSTSNSSADTFDAPPACCECADVFLINDDVLAEQWDAPGSSALISLETLLLNYTDEDGTRWILTDIDGWWTLPQPDLPDLKRAGYLDGSYPVDGRYNAREFTVSGVFLPGPGVSVAVPRQRLLRALDAVRGGALFVAKEPVWAKQAWVYLMDQPKIDTKDARQTTEFQFTLKAVDPIKYHAGLGGLVGAEVVPAAEKFLRRHYTPFPDDPLADERREWPPEWTRLWPASGPFTDEETLRGTRFRYPLDPTVADEPVDAADGTSPNMYRRYQDVIEETGVSVVNVGTTTVYPRFYIYGPIENPRITNLTTGQEMRFSGAIPEGQVLVADCYWRVVVQRAAQFGPSFNPVSDTQGLNRRWMLDFSSEWIGLVPGENVLSLASSSQDLGGRVEVRFRSGWLG